MLLLTLGLLLWIIAHLARRLVPAVRDLARAPRITLMAGVGVIGTGLMVSGYRAAEGEVFWGPYPPLVKANNMLMLLACYLLATSLMKTSITRDLRHPMLWAVVVWAGAHVMVNGDTPSFLLFGGLALWAFLQMWAINRDQPVWEPPPARAQKYEVYAVAATFAVFLGLIGLHYAFGYAVIG